MNTNMHIPTRNIHQFTPGLGSHIDTIVIRHQTLSISDGVAKIYATLLAKPFCDPTQRARLGNIVQEMCSLHSQPWLSDLKLESKTLFCTATEKYHGIQEFKRLLEAQNAASSDQNPIEPSFVKQCVSSIKSLAEIENLTFLVPPTTETENSVAFEYHIVEDAILMLNGWECYREKASRIEPIERDEWHTKLWGRLCQEYTWMAYFTPHKGLLEYGLKLVFPVSREVDSTRVTRMMSKALRGRCHFAEKGMDRGHLFCIAILLIGLDMNYKRFRV